jgi:hypothetical protein
MTLQDKGHHEGQDLPMGSLTYTPPKTMRKFLTSLKLFLSPFWRKFKKGSVLVIEVRPASVHLVQRLPNEHNFTLMLVEWLVPEVHYVTHRPCYI